MRVVLIAIMLAAAQMPYRAYGQPTPSFADELVANVPKLALLKKADPVAFEQIVKVYEDGLKAERPKDETIGLARNAFMEKHAARVVGAPDRLLLQAFDSSLSVIRDLQQRDVERCAALLSGENAGDIKYLLSPATIASEDAVYDAMLTYRPEGFTRSASADEEATFVADAVAGEAASAGAKPREFVMRMYSAPDTYCDLQLAILERMRKAPNAIALFRRRRSVGQGE